MDRDRIPPLGKGRPPLEYPAADPDWALAAEFSAKPAS